MIKDVIVSLKFNGISMDVTGNYYNGTLGTYEQPPEPEEFEITNIELTGDTTVLDLLSEYGQSYDEFLAELETRCLNELER